MMASLCLDDDGSSDGYDIGDDGYGGDGYDGGGDGYGGNGYDDGGGDGWDDGDDGGGGSHGNNGDDDLCIASSFPSTTYWIDSSLSRHLCFSVTDQLYEVCVCAQVCSMSKFASSSWSRLL